MMPSEPDVIALASELIRRPSLTPKDEGCMQLICDLLEPLGFVAERMRFGEVDNLWLRLGDARPLLCFAGHTDVVPTGPQEQWKHPPFAATQDGGMLWGRGAADMKGSVAAMATACAKFVAGGGEPGGSLALLLTSDEEGPAVDGTAKVIQTLAERDEVPDWTLIGEPSAERKLGDRVRIGRRGSLHCYLSVRGVQGHVAYPDQVVNPIQAVAPLLAAIAAEDWGEGGADFPPTSLQMTNINAGTGATNVVPGELKLHFNLRYSPHLGSASIIGRIEALAERLFVHDEASLDLQWESGGEAFLSSSGKLRQAVLRTIAEHTGEEPELSTGGGTSDGRYIAPAGSEVVEFGPRTETIHKVNECVSIEDLRQLEDCYLGIMNSLLRRQAD